MNSNLTRVRNFSKSYIKMVTEQEVFSALCQHLLRRDHRFHCGASFRIPFNTSEAYSAEVNIKKSGTIQVTVHCRNPVTRKRYQEKFVFNEPGFRLTESRANLLSEMTREGFLGGQLNQIVCRPTRIELRTTEVVYKGPAIVHKSLLEH